MGLPKEYSLLFNTLTDLIVQLETITASLKAIQGLSEDMVLAKEEHKVLYFPGGEEGKDTAPVTAAPAMEKAK